MSEFSSGVDPRHPSLLKGLSHGSGVSHLLIGAGVWRGCRGREIGLGQGCLHWLALPPSFTPPQRPLSPLIPCGLQLAPACLPCRRPAPKTSAAPDTMWGATLEAV